MSQNNCFFCRLAAKAAWRELTAFFNSPGIVDTDVVEYYQALLLLAYRISTQDIHSRAGHVLQGLVFVPGQRLDYLRWAREIEIDLPVRYPKYLKQIFQRIERMRKPKCTNEDFSRDASPHLEDGRFHELFGENV